MTPSAPIRRARRRLLPALLAAALLTAGCSEADPTTSPEEPAGDPSAEEVVGRGAIEPGEGDGSVVSRFAGAEWTLGTVPERATPADEGAEPVVVGMINTEGAPAGSLPELRQAVEAAVAFVNAELGGVAGRPIRLVPCTVSLTPESSQACARQLVEEGVVAVLGGIDINAGAALAVLEENGIPYVGGIPVNLEEMRSPLSFQFSGGTPGAFVAFAQHAAEVQGAERVAIVYADLESIRVAALDYGRATLERLGVTDVVEVPFPLVTTDYATVVAQAAEARPDAVLVGAADLACAPVMDAVDRLELDAQVYLVGACAGRDTVEQVGLERVLGTYFNVEGRLLQRVSESADTEVYEEVAAQYAADGYVARGAGTVAFRGAMNLYAALLVVGPDATPADLVAFFRSSRDQPSWDGHPYTCDGRQVPDLPSLCSPQQVLAELVAEEVLLEVSDGWIDVPALVAG